MDEEDSIGDGEGDGRVQGQPYGRRSLLTGAAEWLDIRGVGTFHIFIFRW